jgi:hypothetical protein
MPKHLKEIKPIGDAAAITKRGEALAGTPELYNTGANQERTVTQFPQPLYSVDPYARKARLKAAAVQATAYQATVSDKDVSYLERMHAQQERAAYNVFISNLFDRSRPAERAMLAKLVPEYARVRKDVIDQQAEIQKRLAYLQVSGIQDQEDIDFLWALNRGNVQLPGGPLYDPLTYSTNKGTMYQSGPFARKYVKRAPIDVKKLNESLGFYTPNAASLSGDIDMVGNNNFSPNEVALAKKVFAQE